MDRIAQWWSWLRSQKVGLLQTVGTLSAVYGVWALETEKPGWWAIVAGSMLFVLAWLAENVD